MTWFTDHRMVWIDEVSRIYGYINRGHIMEKFGVSMAQASADINAFMKKHPNTLLYNPSTKRFERVRP